MTPMTRARRVFLTIAAAVGAAALMGAAACASRVADSEPKPERQRYEGPVTTVIDAAIEHGDLSAEQETAVEASRERMSADSDAKRELRQRMRSAAGKMVRGGAADPEELSRAVDEATAAIEERMELGTSALKEVHAMLDADQRGAV